MAGSAALLDEQIAKPFVVPKRIEAQPCLKWVESKTSLLRQLEEFFPHEIDRYFEPFPGGGALFFYLKHRFPDMRPFLRDGNKELINSYRVYEYRYIQNVEKAKLVLVIGNPLTKKNQWMKNYLLNDRGVLLVWDDDGKFRCPPSIRNQLEFLS